MVKDKRRFSEWRADKQVFTVVTHNHAKHLCGVVCAPQDSLQHTVEASPPVINAGINPRG